MGRRRVASLPVPSQHLSCRQIDQSDVCEGVDIAQDFQQGLHTRLVLWILQLEGHQQGLHGTVQRE